MSKILTANRRAKPQTIARMFMERMERHTIRPIKAKYHCTRVITGKLPPRRRTARINASNLARFE